ncbi:MAG: nickel pincer cofactor biosynthesis protein LarC [Dehalococcoidia bacterium]
MGRIAYLDCFSGVSGDMLLGALLDGGVSLEEMRAELAKVPVAGYSLEAERVTKAGLAAVQAIVRVEEPQPPRALADVTALIDKSSLPATDRERAAAVFLRLAEAEAAVHGETVETVHLHDVGAVDAVVDVIGAIVGLRLLGVDELYCSPLPSGAGQVEGPHGALPVPAPATLELLARSGATLRAAGAEEGELVTPTGAAIVTTLARFQRPDMTLQRIGYGAGSRDLPDRPNVLRLWLGESMAAPAKSMVLIETNIDDMTGEMLGYAVEKILAQGAADAWLTPVQMKKGRPAVVLSVLCAESQEEEMARLLLRETTTLGVRVRSVHRWEAEREVLEFESSLGPAAVKVKRLPDEPPRVAPEYEACKRLAAVSGMPLAEVYRIVQAEGEQRLGSP